MEKKKKKDSKKPSPSLLGNLFGGMTGSARKAFRGRKGKLDAAIDGSVKREYKSK